MFINIFALADIQYFHTYPISQIMGVPPLGQHQYLKKYIYLLISDLIYHQKTDMPSLLVDSIITLQYAICEDVRL